MLSLPLLQPESSLLPHQHHYHRRADSPPRQQPHHQQQRPAQRRSSSPNNKNSTTTRSSLAILSADEAAIAHRKAAIRNFGALWIRPSGVPKTLQAMTEEAAELAEAEEQMRQEQGLRDLAAQQQLEEARMRAAEAGMQEEEEEEGQERDLDADIPDADADGEASAEEEEDEEGVTFNESSIVEGSHYAAIEEAELTGAAREMEELGVEPDMEMEHNLDDSVPEAGSYQHTDTEVEDSTSDSEGSGLDDSFAGRQMAQQQQQQSARQSARSTRSTRSSASAQRPPAPQLQPGRLGGLQDRIRAQVATPVNGGAEAGLARSPGSLDLSSSLVESSFVGSSPVAQRGGRGRGGARRRGRMS